MLRILANAAPITGGAAGTLIKLEPALANFQFAEPPALSLDRARPRRARHAADANAIERRRFGAYLIAVRENEEAAEALGVDALAREAQGDLALRGT